MGGICQQKEENSLCGSPGWWWDGPGGSQIEGSPLPFQFLDSFSVTFCNGSKALTLRGPGLILLVRAPLNSTQCLIRSPPSLFSTQLPLDWLFPLTSLAAERVGSLLSGFSGPSVEVRLDLTSEGPRAPRAVLFPALPITGTS